MCSTMSVIKFVLWVVALFLTFHLLGSASCTVGCRTRESVLLPLTPLHLILARAGQDNQSATDLMSWQSGALSCLCSGPLCYNHKIKKRWTVFSQSTHTKSWFVLWLNNFGIFSFHPQLWSWPRKQCLNNLARSSGSFDKIFHFNWQTAELFWSKLESSCIYPLFTSECVMSVNQPRLTIPQW